ncbi:MAG: MFS transporter [Candidatus Marinimicrobia bacterium]|nr:MFS transporter [Candidatus Neomarinimicrobiota bacterium]MCF7850130.1 MFS transporter [Candidatus Neomarinimicrobiota bacterium]MCF7905091.1 MFS transporter [Candidatus Neomarinimicrobiota bacterium]
MLSRYRKISPSVLLMIGAALMLLLVNSSFILILNIYLRKMGYADTVIAQYNSFRFLGTLLFAFPLGIFIKGKPLKPFFITGSIMVPSVSLSLLYCLEHGIELFIMPLFVLWGVSFMIYNVCSLPFIMRSEPEEVVTEAISLSYSTWSMAMIIAGSLINILSRVEQISLFGHQIVFDEYHTMFTIGLLGTLSIFLLIFIKEAKPRSSSDSFFANFKVMRNDYDWVLIGRVLTPNMIIAVGAGLTIPFVNLFFNSVFRLDSEDFSLIGAATAGIVFISTLGIAGIRRRYGFKTAIMFPQILAILFLIVLAMTQLVSHLSWAIYVAIGAFMLRQPLMNMAGPVTSELGMKYVGPRNQELISALSSSIWSASWFISAKIFQYLRQLEMDYYQIFIITAVLYSVGVFFYYMLINDFTKRDQEVEITAPPPQPRV